MFLGAKIGRWMASMSRTPLGSVKLRSTRGIVTKGTCSSWNRGSKQAATKSGSIGIKSVREDIINMDEEEKTLETRKMMLLDYLPLWREPELENMAVKR